MGSNKVLIVDGDPRTLEMLEMYIEVVFNDQRLKVRYGQVEVFKASSREDALKVIIEKNITEDCLILVLMGYRFRDGNGGELAQHIRKVGFIAPLILNTGTSIPSIPGRHKRLFNLLNDKTSSNFWDKIKNIMLQYA